MPLMIDQDACIACSACWAECVYEGIIVDDLTFTIDQCQCCECEDCEEGPQCILVCPSDAIIRVPSEFFRAAM